MLHLSFRTKLTLVMIILVGLGTGVTLTLSLKNLRDTSAGYIDDLAQSEAKLFLKKQELDTAPIREALVKLSVSTRFHAALSEYEEDEVVYLSMFGQLDTRNVVDDNSDLFRIIDSKNNFLITTNSEAGLTENFGESPWEKKLLSATAILSDSEISKESGFLTIQSPEGISVLHSVMTSRIYDDFDEVFFGFLAVLSPAYSGESNATIKDESNMINGIFVEEQLFQDDLTPDSRKMVEKRIQLNQVGKSFAAIPVEDSQLQFSNRSYPHRVLMTHLNPGGAFPPAYFVSLYDLEESTRQEEDLKAKTLLSGSLCMMVALALSLALSHGLSIPIRELVKGTQEIKNRNFDTKVPVRTHDELGQLATSFNEMAVGLGMAEKYRNVLNMVTDKNVAEELLQGKLNLGGEVRRISVLFCDIRGFTSMTQGMAPPRVIEMLNEHMTRMTEVVYRYQGVVDKFVGDEIMVIFGAPKSHENDSQNAVLCAAEMVSERHLLNQTSEFNQIRIGIGIATGEAVAGCMGSSDRMDYTVLGETVNLAARLCGKAPPQEVLIDQATHIDTKEMLPSDPVADLDLKGFSDAIQAYQLIPNESESKQT
jgi:class 3 adenylate cyclase